uniref:ribosomal protein S4 n=1 Tax=Sarcophyte sanguinea TaxID=1618143 RepID=UPI0026E42B2E|nr:ribosomal protein S4 [Sarcophyte sanguinea]WJE89106.1 ribosomal protein S4 [Sarcophyte sanguinea]WJE89125.1 ribosomal protein S4 [Sarcophyte sanguinea]
MLHYRNFRLKKIYRLGNLPGLINKNLKYKKKDNKYIKKSKYCIRLKEKQKLKFNYGIIERQLFNYIYYIIKKYRKKDTIGKMLLKILEMRLDNILFRFGIATTISEARQLINHKHILINNYIINKPNYKCKIGNIITIKKKNNNLIKNFFNLLQVKEKELNYFNFYTFKYKGFINKIIKIEQVSLKINELLILEYYFHKI